jgi:formylmethanofuran dehydrogenase subunit E
MSREKEKQLEAEAKRRVAREEKKLHDKTSRNIYPGNCRSCQEPVAAQQGYYFNKTLYCDGCGSEILFTGP